MDKNNYEELQNITTLYVEDDTVMANLFASHFGRYFKKIDVANNGIEALKMMEKEKYDILMTDIVMPKMNGLELIARVKKIDKEQKVVLISSHDDSKYFIDAIHSGVNEYIVKPFEKEQVLKAASKIAKALQAQKDAERNEQIKSIILKSIACGVVGIKKDLEILFSNDSARRIFKVDDDQSLAKALNEAEELKSDLNEFFSQNEKSLFNERKLLSIGDEKYVKYRIDKYRDEEIQHGAILTFYDVTQALEDRGELEILSKVVEESTSVILITDTEGRIRYVNKKFVSTTGYGFEEALGKNPSILKSNKNPIHIYEEMWGNLTENKSWHGEMVNRRKDGSDYWVNTSIYPIYDTLRKKKYYVGIAEDISEKKEAERRLLIAKDELEERVKKEVFKNLEIEKEVYEQKKLNAMGHMLKDIAHHWRQPLTAIGIMVQNIKEMNEDGSLNKDMINDMVERSLIQLHQISKTIDDFRNFYKTSEGTKTFDLLKIVRDSIFLVSAQATEKNQEILFINDTPDEYISINGYESELKQVVVSILKNAIDSIAQKRKIDLDLEGKIEVKISKSDEKLVSIRFRDNGIGLSEEAIERVYEPYYTTKEVGEGSGIGLFMSKTVIEKHFEGQLKANRIEEGAEFEILLPLKGNYASI